MATTAQSSTEYTNATATPVTIANPDQGGSIRYLPVTFTQSGAGDASSTVDLAFLPAGRVRVIGPLCTLDISAFGASRTLDIGWTAYTDLDGAAVAADADGLDDGLDVSSASAVPLGTVVGDGDTYMFESRDGVTLQATVLGGTIPDAATIKGFIAYVIA